MSMSRKHFRAFAEAMHRIKPSESASGESKYRWEQACQTIAGVCAESNPRFDWSSFIEACNEGL